MLGSLLLFSCGADRTVPVMTYRDNAMNQHSSPPRHDKAGDTGASSAPPALAVAVLQHERQRLSVLPGLGGSLASWEYQAQGQWTPLLRPWNGSSDLYTTACFPLVPWSNRITADGFIHRGQHYPVRPNRAGEAYPIHGDGWLQAWQIVTQEANRIELQLDSCEYDNNPYTYQASQTFSLSADGLEIQLSVTNRGSQELPFGLGLHPYFLHNPATRLQSRANGVWLCGADPIPTGYTRQLPVGWDYNHPAALTGDLIDNCFSGWDGLARIDYPDRGLRIEMQMQDCNGLSLMYRPPGLDYFCLEPITHPIDAFHMSDRLGLVNLTPGATMQLVTHFKVSEL